MCYYSLRFIYFVSLVNDILVRDTCPNTIKRIKLFLWVQVTRRWVEYEFFDEENP